MGCVWTVGLCYCGFELAGATLSPTWISRWPHQSGELRSEARRAFLALLLWQRFSVCSFFGLVLLKVGCFAAMQMDCMLFLQSIYKCVKAILVEGAHVLIVSAVGSDACAGLWNIRTSDVLSSRSLQTLLDVSITLLKSLNQDFQTALRLQLYLT